MEDLLMQMQTPEQTVMERVEQGLAPPPNAEAPARTFEAKNVSIWYGQKRAIEDVTLDIASNAVTAIIGPSGCGKSTFLRALNRMHELTPGTRMEGTVLSNGEDLYSSNVDATIVRVEVLAIQEDRAFHPRPWCQLVHPIEGPEKCRFSATA